MMFLECHYNKYYKIQLKLASYSVDIIYNNIVTSAGFGKAK